MIKPRPNQNTTNITMKCDMMYRASNKMDIGYINNTSGESNDMKTITDEERRKRTKAKKAKKKQRNNK